MTAITRRQALGLAGAALAGTAVVGGAALSGCAGLQSSEKSSGAAAIDGGPVDDNTDEVIVVMSKTSEPSAGFDPIYSWGCGEHVHEPLIQSTLITTDYEMGFVNDLATSYESSEDGMTWTFTIRDDTYFTDGEKLTADDVAFTLNAIKGNPASEMDLSMIDSAEAADPTTVIVHMAYPYNALLFDLAVIGIVPEHAYDSKTYGSDPIGSGRYILEQWNRGEQVILRANPDYYGEAPTMKKVVVVFMDESASMAAAMASQVDVAYTSATLVGAKKPGRQDAAVASRADSSSGETGEAAVNGADPMSEAKGDSGAAVEAGSLSDAKGASEAAEESDLDSQTSYVDEDVESPNGYVLYVCSSVDSRGISLPCVPAGAVKSSGGQEYPAGNDVTADVYVRRAINAATNRESMIESVLNSYGTEAFSVADAMPWYNPAMKVDFDLDEARSHMEEGGWALSDDGIYEKDGQRAEFDLYYSADDSVRQALANEFANQMRKLGIRVTPVGSSWTHDRSGIYYHQYSDPVLWGWGSNSPTQFYNLTLSTSASNYSVYSSEEIDGCLKAALATPTVEGSYPDWQAAQWNGTEGIAPQGASTWAWLCNVDHLYYKRSRLQIARQKPHPHGHGWSLVNNVDRWYWE